VSGKEILMHAVFWAKVETFVSTFFTFEKIVYDIIYALIRPTEKGGGRGSSGGGASWPMSYN
jgi:hypothetical protein